MTHLFKILSTAEPTSAMPETAAGEAPPVFASTGETAEEFLRRNPDIAAEYREDVEDVFAEEGDYTSLQAAVFNKFVAQMTKLMADNEALRPHFEAFSDKLAASQPDSTEDSTILMDKFFNSVDKQMVTISELGRMSSEARADLTPALNKIGTDALDFSKCVLHKSTKALEAKLAANQKAFETACSTLLELVDMTIQADLAKFKSILVAHIDVINILSYQVYQSRINHMNLEYQHELALLEADQTKHAEEELTRREEIRTQHEEALADIESRYKSLVAQFQHEVQIAKIQSDERIRQSQVSASSKSSCCVM